MNDKRDMAPMVWGYIKSRETARRMNAYAGEVTGMHPHFKYNSPARAFDLDLATTNAYAGPNHHSAGIQHGSWSHPLGPGEQPASTFLNSHKQETRAPLDYSADDLEQIEKWGESCQTSLYLICCSILILVVQRHVETTWHSLGTCSMAPREGNSFVKHGVVDERLNVHGVKGLKVCDLSICPDNVGCNTFSVSPLIFLLVFLFLDLANLILYQTALLIGEKCAVLTAEDLGYSGSALEMRVPTYHAPGEVVNLARL